MKNILCLTLATCALGALPCAYAADKDNPFYAGAAVGTAAQLTHVRNGVRTDSDRPNPFRVYGGYDLNKNFAIEAGYTYFGGFDYPNGLKTEIGSLHVAMKAGMALGESFTLYGKAGASRMSVEQDGPFGSGKVHDVRPLIGVGASYRLTDSLALTLDVTDYGRVKKPGLSLKPRTIELGLRYQW